MAGGTVYLKCSLFTVVLCVIFNSSNARPELKRGSELPEEFPKTCGYDVRRIIKKIENFNNSLDFTVFSSTYVPH